MANSLNLADIFAQFEQENHEPGGQIPQRSTRSNVSVMTPAGDTSIQEADLHRMVGEAQRNVKLQSGLIGHVLGRLRGDDFQRSQYKTMLARIDAFNTSEQAKLALIMTVSLQVLGFKVAISGAEEMERYLGRFDPSSAAANLGRALLEENVVLLHQVVQEISAKGRQGTTRALGMNQ